MGAMQNPTLQIGLVTFNVAMVKASNERNTISFNRVHKHADGSLSPTGNREYCKDATCANNSELPRNLTTKGYNYSKGKYVEVSDAELDSLRVASNNAIITHETVSLDEFKKRPYMLAGNIYYLVTPDKEKFPQTYALMFSAMKADNQVVIGRFALHGRLQAVAVVPGDTCFVMYSLRFPEEVRQAPQLQLPPIDQNQLGLARQVLQMLAKPEMDLNYQDDYEAAKQALVDAKIQGVAPAQLPQAPPVVVNNNIDDMLKKTLEQFKREDVVPAKRATKAKAENAKPTKKGKKRKAA